MGYLKPPMTNTNHYPVEITTDWLLNSSQKFRLKPFLSSSIGFLISSIVVLTFLIGLLNFLNGILNFLYFLLSS